MADEMFGELSEGEHKLRHAQLHKALDELVGDFINHTGGFPSKTTVLELMKWSYEQTKNPSVKEDNEP